MNIRQANNPEAGTSYVGKCKNNNFPKHVGNDTTVSKKVTLLETDTEGKVVKHKATFFNSPKTAEYVYVQLGDRKLWVKNKSIMDNGDTFEIVKTERKKVAKTEQPEGN